MFLFKKYNYYENHKEKLKDRLKWFEIIKSIMLLKCNKCGYDKTWHALHFHHIDPLTKKFTISSMMHKKPNKLNIQLMKNELKKCVCLCATCHMEQHIGEYDLILHYDKINNIVNTKKILVT